MPVGIPRILITFPYFISSFVQLDLDQAVAEYKDSRKRLLVLGYNATLTTAVEAPRQPKKHFDQIQALTRVNPAAYSCLAALSQDPSVEVIIFSGSVKERLVEVFDQLPVWLAAENGAVLRPPGSNDWITVVDTVNAEWKESVQLVFEYFCERTPRSFVEQRGTSLVWNYKYADVEFGRIQARDLLQHLLTGPISNAPVDIVRGSKSIEVRPVGVSKGSSMERILGVMATYYEIADTDFVLVAGHFLARDENVFTMYEGQQQQPVASVVPASADQAIGQEVLSEPWRQHPSLGIFNELNLGSDLTALDRLPPAITAHGGTKAGTNTVGAAEARRRLGQTELPFALPPKHLFTCTVGRNMASKAK